MHSERQRASSTCNGQQEQHAAGGRPAGSGQPGSVQPPGAGSTAGRPASRSTAPTAAWPCGNQPQCSSTHLSGGAKGPQTALLVQRYCQAGRLRLHLRPLRGEQLIQLCQLLLRLCGRQLRDGWGGADSCGIGVNGAAAVGLCPHPQLVPAAPPRLLWPLCRQAAALRGPPGEGCTGCGGRPGLQATSGGVRDWGGREVHRWRSEQRLLFRGCNVWARWLLGSWKAASLRLLCHMRRGSSSLGSRPPCCWTLFRSATVSSLALVPCGALHASKHRRSAVYGV